MKQILLLTAFLIAVASNAQLSLTWLGNNTVNVSNGLSCTADVRISWLNQAGLQKDSVVTVGAGGQVNVVLSGALAQASDIKAKSDAPCSSNGWVKVVTGGTLPVHFSFFSVQQSGNGVILNWGASIDYVDIERSTDGVNFQTILKSVRSSALDLSPATGTNFYRLKASGGYSQIRKIAITDKLTAVGVFTISGDGMSRSIGAVPPGLYLIKFSDGSGRLMVKR